MKKISRLSTISSSIFACIIAGQALAVETERNLELSTQGIQSIMVDTGSGSLTIEGKAGLDKIEAHAKITIDGVDDDEVQEWMDKYMDLSIKNKRGRAIVCASFGYSFNSTCSAKKKMPQSWFGWNKERKIDLVVYVPQNLDLEVDDGSGWSKVTNLNADLEFDDGSGDLEVASIVGNVKIDDGSGTLVVTDIDGDLFVDDGSGKLIIDQVTGKVDIDDGSGHIKITNVAKKVYIDDGSGSVDACHLGSDLTVDDGSGSVDTCDDIKGKIVVK